MCLLLKINFILLASSKIKPTNFTYMKYLEWCDLRRQEVELWSPGEGKAVLLLRGNRVPRWEDGNVLEMDGSDVCATVQMDFIPLDRTLQNGYNGPGPCGSVGWSVIPYTKSLRVRFLVRAHAWTVAWSPSPVAQQRKSTDVSLSLADMQIISFTSFFPI